MRELVVLGTASQVPTRERNQNGYLLLWDGEGLLFDPGEGTQRQMIHAGVAASRITRICLTHVHGDHCYGVPGVLSRMALDGVEHPVHLHYPASGEPVVRALVSLASGRLDLRLHPHGAAGEVAPGWRSVRCTTASRRMGTASASRTGARWCRNGSRRSASAVRISAGCSVRDHCTA
jgi:ribonuclease Z